jgi:dienelactone hydrolase
MRASLLLPLFLLLLTTACTPAHHAVPGDYGLHEELLRIPATIHGQTYGLETTVFRPAPRGRFPLLVINHGTNAGTAARDQPRYAPLAACAELVKQGYAVALPMRRGYADSDGEQVRIHDDDLTAYGLENALDIKAAVEWLERQDWVQADRVFVIGQSTGGLATMAYLSMADPGVLGAVNFHGGVRPRDLESDPLLDARVAAFATYAKTTRLPSVWLYTANDHSSRPPFIQRLHAAYQAAGGHAELHQLPAFKADGHGLFGDRAGTAIWAPIVSAFLSTH